MVCSMDDRAHVLMMDALALLEGKRQVPDPYRCEHGISTAQPCEACFKKYNSCKHGIPCNTTDSPCFTLWKNRCFNQWNNPDPVNKPQHYTFGRFEVIDVIEDWQLGFHTGNVVKYIARAKHKGNELEDLRKARWYLDRAIKRLESE